MRATEFIRNILDLIDQVDDVHQPDLAQQTIYSDEDRKMDQISDFINADDDRTYDNEPNEVISDFASVTTDAGGGVNGPKHPADIRGEHSSMYPNKQWNGK
jgi:hypothetical protein